MYYYRKWDKDEIIPDIEAIPDLDSEDANNLPTEIMQAPRIRAHKVQGLDELDGDIQPLPSGGFEGLDLSILTSALYPPAILNEIDETWDFDTLITEVASVMQDEQDIHENDNEDDRDEDEDKKRGFV